MSLFQNILNEISKRIQVGQSNKVVIAEILSKTLNINIKTEEINIKNNTLFLNTSPTIRSIIFLKKEKVLESLSSFNIKSIG